MPKLIDETGKRYGRWTVISKGKRTKRIQPARWECLCDCGTIKDVLGTSLRFGLSQSCGCLQQDGLRERKLDLTGLEYGRLKVIEYAGSNKHQSATWLCRCECGKERIYATGNLQSGNSTSCGCFDKRRLLPEDEAAFRSLYSGMQKGAKERGHKWDLTVDQVRHITQQDCFYCGSAPSMHRYSSRRIKNHTYIYNGIDRKDSSVGYVTENAVPCCWPCNRAKGTLPMAQFEEWIKKVYDHLLTKDRQNAS